MVKNEIIVIADFRETTLTLDELCELCHFSKGMVEDLVRYEIVHPSGDLPQEWIFTVDELSRIKKALRLKRDLDVNFAGVSIVLDLLDEMEKLRTEIALLERHYSR